MRLINFCVMTLLFCLPALAQVKIQGPEHVEPHSGLIQLDVEGATGEVAWAFLFDTIDHRVINDGKSLILASPSACILNVQCISWEDKSSDILSIKVGDTEPPIVDPPAPVDPVDPVVEMASDFRVLILWEAQSPTDSAHPALVSTGFRAWLEDTAKLDDAGGRGWRLYDDDMTDEQIAVMHDKWKAAYLRAKKDSNGKTPWLLITDDTNVVSEPLAADSDGVKQQIGRYVR